MCEVHASCKSYYAVIEIDLKGEEMKNKKCEVSCTLCVRECVHAWPKMLV